MTTIQHSPVTPVHQLPAATPGAANPRRRRVVPASHAAAGAALLAPTQQLPFAAGASVRVHGSLLAPIAGAVIGTLLLGLPGTILGGIIGFMIS